MDEGLGSHRQGAWILELGGCGSFGHVRQRSRTTIVTATPAGGSSNRISFSENPHYVHLLRQKDAQSCNARLWGSRLPRFLDRSCISGSLAEEGRVTLRRHDYR
jgi:hypothetical protein